MSNPQHEPTMEEILASIRKIISEDSTEGQAAAPQAEPQAAAPPPVVSEAPAAMVESDDVLELTEEVSDELTPAPTPAATPAGDKADEVVFQSIEEEPVSEPQAATPVPEPAYSEPAPVENDIFSDKTRKALDDAFASIEPEEEPAGHAPPGPLAPIDGASVEAVFERAVRESFDPVLREWLGENADAIVERMKPVIREWLDKNFPPMLEEAVRNEVARVAKSRRR